ncbi:MAG: radical SAM protein, partial [Deltaproteobacteria bacterium]|nr:radical SAM protein [Deltaproteobacteria bacterium]
MCFPLGVVTAFYGVSRSMNLLHGSQGCSTYIRRHMATHYNEPVDIASSSLSEEGTVFGGEKNLLKGLNNLIRLYKPEIIGVSTTCLAETIGEDLAGSLKKFKDDNPNLKTTLIPVNAPGYGGTHFEGYWRGLKAITANLDLDSRAHGGLNIIIGPASPADVRSLKEFLNQTGLSYTIFPDISDNLDGGFNPIYSRLPLGGTTLSDIIKMAGAGLTLELSLFVPPEDSPGLYLEKNYGVKCLKLAPPIGLKATDDFIKTIRDFGGQIPKSATEERGRLMDAMGDSHKYSALGRAAVFGDPDFVYSTSRLCAENGLVTKLAATGSKCPSLIPILNDILIPVSSVVAAGEVKIADSADFALIETESQRLGVNILIGSSEGRRLSQKKNIPLVRATFPIHDHVGGQRVRTMGYLGSTIYLDRMVNQLISQEEESFRSEIKSEHFRNDETQNEHFHNDETHNDQIQYHSYVPRRGSTVYYAPPRSNTSPVTVSEPDLAPWGLPGRERNRRLEETAAHPCFNLTAAHNSSRLHLPVSPGCNISCNYCRRDTDCPNESRPGVSSSLLSPEEALERFKRVKKELGNLKVVGFAGPGESLNCPDLLLKTMELVRREDNHITLCLSTNGLMLPFYVTELHSLGLNHLTVTVNTLDLKIGQKIYAWVNYFGERYQGQAASQILLANQLSGIAAAKGLGMTVKINTVLLSGINESQVANISKKMASLGADLANIMPHIPVPGSVFENLSKPEPTALRDLRYAAGAYMPQMTHCRQCRADAAGLLGQDMSFSSDREAPNLESLMFNYAEKTDKVAEGSVEDNSNLQYKIA